MTPVIELNMWNIRDHAQKLISPHISKYDLFTPKAVGATEHWSMIGCWSYPIGRHFYKFVGASAVQVSILLPLQGAIHCNNPLFKCGAILLDSMCSFQFTWIYSTWIRLCASGSPTRPPKIPHRRPIFGSTDRDRLYSILTISKIVNKYLSSLGQGQTCVSMYQYGSWI